MDDNCQRMDDNCLLIEDNFQFMDDHCYLLDGNCQLMDNLYEYILGSLLVTAKKLTPQFDRGWRGMYFRDSFPTFQAANEAEAEKYEEQVRYS